MFIGVEHFAIASPDPPRLAQWYVDKLQFTINYQSARTVFVKAPNGALIEIITAEGDRPEQTMKTPGMRHIAIAVDDFDAAYGRLKSQRVQFVGEPEEKKGVRVVFFTDPEGNYLHLIRRETPLP